MSESEITLNKKNAHLLTRIAELEGSLERLKRWVKYYPLEVFPEPDLELTAEGITLDAVSASNMRHVLTQIEKMQRNDT